MRNRLVLIGKILAVSLILFVVVAMFATRPDIRGFKFLEGKKAVYPASTSDRPVDRAYYSFEGDYDAVAKAARAELLSRGYKEISTPDHARSSAQFVIGDWDGFRDNPSRDTFRKVQFVYVDKDRGLGKDEFEFNRSGWILVKIVGQPSQSFFERLADFLGL